MAEIVPLRQGEATVFWIELYIVQVVLGLTISDAETKTFIENQIDTNSVAGLATCVTKTSASVVLFMEKFSEKFRTKNLNMPDMNIHRNILNFKCRITHTHTYI